MLTPTWVTVLLSKNVALVAISNGLGHLRRQIFLYKYLKSQGYDVTIFCNLADLERLDSHNLKTEQLEIRVADLPRLVKSGFFEALSKRLSSFDVVVSDNCVDLLRSRQDIVLFASFFWHRAISMPSWYGLESEKLIDLYKPKIIANRLFVADYLKDYTNLHLVGFFGSQPIKTDLPAEDILLSFGFSNEINKYFLEIANYVAEFCLSEGRKLWLEPRYFKKINAQSDLVVKASYTDKMYKSIGLGIIRPGMGTLTNLIAARSKIICVYEENNNEMILNSNRINDLGFGVNASNLKVLGKLLKNLDTVPMVKIEKASGEFDGEVKSFKVIKTSG